ncbi:MAG: hypothetical protein WC366_03240 [Bacilli bacterium]
MRRKIVDYDLINMEQYRKNLSHYKHNKILAAIIFSLLECSLAALTIYGFINYQSLLFLGGMCMVHLIIIPFWFFRNFFLVCDIIYFGYSNLSNLGRVFIQFLLVFATEACTIGIGFIFMDHPNIIVISLSVFCIFAIIAFIILDKFYSYPNAVGQVYIDKNLYK